MTNRLSPQFNLPVSTDPPLRRSLEDIIGRVVDQVNLGAAMDSEAITTATTVGKSVTLVDTTATPIITCTLIPAIDWADRVMYIRNVADKGYVKVVPQSGELIEGTATAIVSASDAISVISDGSDWQVVSSRRSPSVANVKDFGAQGDGTTDDTAAIQAAADSLGSGGGRVFFPACTYLVQSTVTVLTNNVTFEGAGTRATTIKSDSTTADVFAFGSTGAVISSIFVHSMGFDCTVTKTAGAAINFTRVAYGAITDIFTTTHFYSLELIDSVLIVVDGCYLNAHTISGGVGIVIDGSATSPSEDTGGNDQYLSNTLVVGSVRVSNTTVKVADSPQTAFPHAIQYSADSELVVTLDNVLLTLTTDYTLSADLVTLVVGATTGQSLQIRRNVAQDAGVLIKKTGATWLDNCGGLMCDIGLKVLAESTGDVVEHIFSTRSAFDTCASHAILIQANTGATVRRSKFIGDWSASSDVNGLTIAGAGTVQALSFIGHRSLNNRNHGVSIQTTGTCEDISLNGMTLTGNSGATTNAFNGIDITAVVDRLRITDNTSGATGGFGNVQKYGLNITGACTNVIVTGNDFTNNVTGPLSITPARSSTVRVNNNLGVTANNEGTFTVDAPAATAWTFGLDEATSIITVAGGTGSTAIAVGSGMVMVSNHTNGDVGAYLVGGGGVAFLGNTGATWVATTTTPALGTASIAWDGVSAYKVYNNLAASPGGDRSFRVMSFKTRAAA